MSKKKRIHIATDEDTRKFGGAAAPGREGPRTGDPPPSTGADEDAVAAGSEPTDELATLRNKVEELEDRLLRAKAEGQNLLRRTAQEKSDAIRYANESLVKALLPAVDDLERTLEAAERAGNVGALVEGVRLIHGKLLKVLTDHDVTPIEALGKPFDPVFHSAVIREPSGNHVPGTVSRELQKGYRLRDRVVRPSQVALAAEPEPETGPETGSEPEGE